LGGGWTARDIGLVSLAFVGGYLIVTYSIKMWRTRDSGDPFDQSQREALGIEGRATLDEVKLAFHEGLLKRCESLRLAASEDEREALDREICRMVDAYIYFRRKYKASNLV